jgi:DNA recombination protein RmuC
LKSIEAYLIPREILAPELQLIIAGILIGSIVAALWVRRSAQQQVRQLDERHQLEQERLATDLHQSQTSLLEAEQGNTELAAELEQINRLRVVSETEKARLEEQLASAQRAEHKLEEVQQELRNEIHVLKGRASEDKAELAELNTRLEEQQRHNEDKLQELENARKRMTTEFENLANRILEEKGRRFDEHSRRNMDEMLKPVRQQLTDFRSRVDEIYTQDTKERSSLKEQLRQLQDLNQQMNEEARNLTRALKGDKKTQGNWGELILERVLEQSGLRKGKEYEVQGSFRDSEGKLLRPDVIIHLPEGKDIIVDSKVSLVAYDEYVRADNEVAQKEALQGLVMAVKNHIDGLSQKSYEDLKGINSLDFVLMFMPIEPAFVAAFQEDTELFSKAFERKIVVVTPTTLLATLRTIENIWRFERQNENARKIADKAGALYDKLRGFLEDFEKVGAQLDTVHKTYEDARNKLVVGRGNVIRRTEEFVELGIKVKKSLPQPLLDDALLEDQDKE